ncbi:kinase-like domain-containing protein, partial [Zopfochytrium polystomum]
KTDPSGRFSRYRKALGKGAYKAVYKAFDEEEGKEVAWNQLRVDHLAKRDAQRVLSEIAILQSLRNDYIINLLHHWEAKGRDGRERVYFITELMTSGTLKTFLKKSKAAIKPKVLRSYCKQILLGLEYLHSRSPPIIHRDLKCDNIFVNGFNGQVKLGDLGLAIVKSRDHVSSVLGTPEFMAPELYDENYDEKVDIYAFGMVVMEIVTKEYPYSECTNQAQIYKRVTSQVKPLAIQKVQDRETREFIELCTRFNPAERPSARELLQSSFLNAPIPQSTDALADADVLSESVVTLRMVYSVPGREKAQEIRFPFNLPEDTATDVISEMVKENLIDAADEQLARRKLEEKVKGFLLAKITPAIRGVGTESQYTPVSANSSRAPSPIHMAKPHVVGLEL